MVPTDVQPLNVCHLRRRSDACEGVSRICTLLVARSEACVWRFGGWLKCTVNTAEGILLNPQLERCKTLDRLASFILLSTIEDIAVMSLLVRSLRLLRPSIFRMRVVNTNYDRNIYIPARPRELISSTVKEAGRPRASPKRVGIDVTVVCTV